MCQRAGFKMLWRITVLHQFYELEIKEGIQKACGKQSGLDYRIVIKIMYSFED